MPSAVQTIGRDEDEDEQKDVSRPSASVVAVPKCDSDLESRRAADRVTRPHATAGNVPGLAEGEDEIALLSVEGVWMETEARASSETLEGDSVQVNLEEGIEGLDDLSAPVKQELGQSEPELGHDQRGTMVDRMKSDSEAKEEEDMSLPSSDYEEKEDDEDNEDWFSDGEGVRDVITGDPITPKGILKDSMARYGRIRIELGLSGNEPIPSYAQGSGDRAVFWRAALADRRQRLREYQTRVGREIDYISHVLSTF